MLFACVFTNNVFDPTIFVAFVVFVGMLFGAKVFNAGTCAVVISWLPEDMVDVGIDVICDVRGDVKVVVRAAVNAGEGVCSKILNT